MPILERKFVLDAFSERKLKADIDKGNPISLDQVLLHARPVEFRSNALMKPSGPFLQFALLLADSEGERYGVVERYKHDVESDSRRTGGLSLLICDGPKIDLYNILLNQFMESSARLVERAKLVFEPFGVGYTDGKMNYYFMVFRIKFEEGLDSAVSESLVRLNIKDRFHGIIPLSTSIELYTSKEGDSQSVVVSEHIKEKQIGRCDAAVVEAILSDNPSGEYASQGKSSIGFFRRIGADELLYDGMKLSDQKGHWGKDGGDGQGRLEDFQALEGLKDSLRQALTAGTAIDPVFSEYLREATILLEAQQFLAAQVFIGACCERLVSISTCSFIDFLANVKPSELAVPKGVDVGPRVHAIKVGFGAHSSISSKLKWCSANAAGLDRNEVFCEAKYKSIKDRMYAVMRERNNAAHPGEEVRRAKPNDLYNSLAELKTSTYPFYIEAFARSEWGLLQAVRPKGLSTFGDDGGWLAGVVDQIAKQIELADGVSAAFAERNEGFAVVVAELGAVLAAISGASDEVAHPLNKVVLKEWVRSRESKTPTEPGQPAYDAFNGDIEEITGEGWLRLFEAARVVALHLAGHSVTLETARIAHALIFRKDQTGEWQVLCRLDEDKETRKVFLKLIGGHLEGLETPKDAVLREIAQELRLIVENGNVEILDEYECYPDVEWSPTKLRNREYTFFPFLVRVSSSCLEKIDMKKNQWLNWNDFEEKYFRVGSGNKRSDYATDLRKRVSPRD